MALIVVKRDGGKTPFDRQRIEVAVMKAAEAVGVKDNSFCKRVASNVEEMLKLRNEVDISEIQKNVEDLLMSSNYKTLARAYIEYRHERDRLREKKGALSREIKGLIDQSNADLLNENANKDSKVIPTQRDLLAGIVARHYAKQHMLPQEVVRAHERGEIHFHGDPFSRSRLFTVLPDVQLYADRCRRNAGTRFQDG